MYGRFLGRPKPEGSPMKMKNLKSTLLVFLIATAGLAGCIGAEEEETEETFGSDGGYTYVSDVQVYADMAQDVCDIKDLVDTYDWAAIKAIYTDGENVVKSDGSYKTLAQHAAASGKKHGLQEYYGVDAPLDAYMMAALDGTGMFEGASDSMRAQAVEKAAQNQILVAYAIHELNSAIAKATDGNWGTDGAQHAWDEGWALYHGATDHASCAAHATGDKRAGNFATTVSSTDSTAKANAAILVAMNEGLAALQAEDLAGATAARDEVVKNIVIIYSQATIRYASKMTTDSTLEDAQTHQAEGYSFWRVIEMYVAANNAADTRNDMCHNLGLGTTSADNATTCSAYTFMENHTMSDGSDICYNMVTHSVSSDDNSSCGAYSYLTNYTMNDGQDICYNMVSHSVSSDDNSSCGAYTYLTNYTMNDGQDLCYNSVTHASSTHNSTVCASYGFYNTTAPNTAGEYCYNGVSHAFNADNQSVCEDYAYYENYSMGGTTFTGCYNLQTHTTSNVSQEECEAYAYYNDNDVVDTYCYNMAIHSVDYDATSAICGAYMFVENYGATVTDGCYNAVTHTYDVNMSQSECEAYGYYLNYGATVTNGCYNSVTHMFDVNMTQTECEAFGYYLNYGATVFTGCYNTMTHATIADQTDCAYSYHQHYGVDVINSIYNFDNLPVEGTLYEASVRSALQPTWTALGIDAATDIGELV